MSRNSIRSTCFAAAFTVAVTSSASAQDWLSSSLFSAPAADQGRTPLAQVTQPPSGPPATPRHTGFKALVKSLGSDVKHLPSKENLMWVGIGGGLALAAHPFDDEVNRTALGPTANAFFKPGSVVGESGTLFGAAAITYAVGRLRDEPKVSHVGMDLIRALAISEGLTQITKYSVRRERPDHSSRNSFPSGHAADTFAVATALERHLGWRFAGPAYALASYVAFSRLPANRHWLSDAVFGCAVGIIAGRTVTSRETQPFPIKVAMIPGGAEIVFTARRR